MTAAAAAATATALDLRQHLAQRFPGAAVPLAGRRETGIASGMAAFDAVLPHAGLPRGRPTLWHAPAPGAIAILSAMAHALLERGLRTAWIDGGRVLGGWRDGPPPLVIRPRTPLLGLRFAELLLMSGGFALVVLHGVATDRSELFRLGRAAHEGGGALAVIADASLQAPLRLQSHYLAERAEYIRTPFGDPARVHGVTLAIEARSSGWHARTTLTLPVTTHDVRSALDCGLADRRGSE